MIRTKIIVTIFLIVGFFFFRLVPPLLIRALKGLWRTINPELAEDASCLFKLFELFFKGFSILCFVLIVLIWTDLITVGDG